jgi:adenylosuccinate lyase
VAIDEHLLKETDHSPQLINAAAEARSGQVILAAGLNSTKDADISSHLSSEEIARVFDLKHYIRNVDKVFERVFG